MRSRLHDLGIRPKLLGSFGIILLITMTLGVLAYRAAFANERASEQTLHTQEVIIEIESLVAALSEMRIGRSGYLLTGDEVTLTPFTQGAATYPVILDQLETLTVDNPEQTGRWARLRPMIDSWLNATLTPSLDLRGDASVLEADQQAAIATAIIESREEFLALQEIVNDALTEEQELLATRTDAANRENARLKQTMVIGTISALALGVAMAVFIARELAGAMDQLTGLARHMSRGNYNQRISMNRRDEIGQTADALDQMAADLEQSVHQLETTVGRAERSEERTAAILTNAAEGIITVSHGGAIQSMNPAAERMFARSSTDMRDRPFDSLLDRDELPEGARSWFDSLRPGDAGARSTHHESIGCRPDGSGFPVELGMSGMVQDGETQYIAIARDITERYEAERQLRHQFAAVDRARSVSDAVFNAASEAMVLISPDMRIIAVNERFEEVFAIASDEIVGRPLRDYDGDAINRRFADPERFRAMLESAVQDTERQGRDSFEQVWPEPRVLELYSAPVRTRASEHLGRLLAFRDVTHEREIDRMKTEFVSMVSHELRTPLTSIKGFVDLLLEGDAGELTADQHGFLDIVGSNADRLVSLINDILDISRIESGKIDLNRQSVDVASLISELARSFEPQLDAKGQTLSVETPPGMLPILADPARLMQILTNLISNAHKYTPQGGRITLRAEDVAAGIQVRVSDTGIGLSEEEQGQLFKRFYRARNRTTETVSGTGLGLAITRSLIELHGGTITVESAPGTGSTFTLTLPRSIPSGALPAATAPAPSSSAQRSALPNLRVLIVEDEPDIALLIRHYLERSGYEVHIAHSAEDGLELARRLEPALITLDVLLPDQNGFAVLERLKADPATCHIPVVMLSMLPDDGTGKRLGAVEYFSKPIHEDVLLKRLGGLLTFPVTRTILVADDDDDVRHLIVQRLNRAGYKTIEAADGHEAVRQALAHDLDLLLLDVKMPNLDGIGALTAIRKTRTVDELPVVMMTASPDVLESGVADFIHLGVTRLLQKSVTAEEMAHIIAQHLSQ